jgi:glycosyltransferase involved in cell wall biosynthesis
MRRRLLGIGFDDVHVLGRGVDGELFDPARRAAGLRAAWGAGSEDLVALYVGRLAPEKNVRLVVEAYRAMRRVQSAARCVIVGDGPLRRELETAHPDLVFCGMRTGEELAAHYASADVFLFPSETETFGNVTLEAMASGLAVVAYDYAAARIHVAHGESGVLVPRGDARAFVEGAAALARRPACLPEMRRRARAHAASVDWPSVVAAFEALLTCPFEERAGSALAAGSSGAVTSRRGRDGRAAARGEASGYGSPGERERATRVKSGRPL